MQEDREYSKEEVKEAAALLKSMREQLACVPAGLLRKMIRSLEYDEAFGCLLDPTACQQRDRKDRSVQKETARKLLELKAIWDTDEVVMKLLKLAAETGRAQCGESSDGTA